ncbi:MAG TPA: hypothetical protein VFZ61_29115, partial [Polyangiales bacterium]
MTGLVRVRASLAATGLLVLGAVVGCSPEPDGGLENGPSQGIAAGGGAVGPGGSAAGTTPDAGAVTPGPGTGSSVSPVIGDAGAAPGTPRDGGATASGNSLPCAVKKIIDAKCGACHSDPPMGTYMALTTHAHFHAQGTSDASKKYWQLTKARINAGANPMPPAVSPGGPLTADEKATLNAWLDQSAPASNETCAPSAAPDGGVGTAPIDTTGLECVKFLAHARGSKTGKFKVGTAKDKYFNFGFQAPWTSMVYGIVVRPVIDNAKVLHHWLLYREPIGDGEIQETIGQHTGGELLHGWAPGGIALNFRSHGPDVGFELPTGSYAVEFHYNSADANAEDASGVEVCYQRNAPKNIAGMSWLGWDQGGSLSFAAGGVCLAPATKWTGTCKPAAQSQPIHMLFMIPHLHQTGRHLKSVIKGVDGKERILHDKPFDFAYQTTYETR